MSKENEIQCTKASVLILRYCASAPVDETISCMILFLSFVRTMEEGIKRANNTTYGLAAGVITKDLNVANTVSRSVRAGIVWINCYTVFDTDCPCGGYKMSGFGRDHGLDALNQYLQIKSVLTPIHDSPWHWT